MGMRYEKVLRMQKEPARSEKAVLLPNDIAASATLRDTVEHEDRHDNISTRTETQAG